MALMLVIFLHVFVIYLPAVGGEEGPGEPEQCITQQRQPTALNKTRSPFNQPGLALLSQSGHLSPPHFTLELLLAADVQEPLPCEGAKHSPAETTLPLRLLSPYPPLVCLGRTHRGQGDLGQGGGSFIPQGQTCPGAQPRAAQTAAPPELPGLTGAWRVFKTQSNFLLEAVDKSAQKLENPLCFRDGCCKIM